MRRVTVDEDLLPFCRASGLALGSLATIQGGSSLRENEAMKGRYIRASELASFAFCERAWQLDQRRVPSSLQDERAVSVRRAHPGGRTSIRHRRVHK